MQRNPFFPQPAVLFCYWYTILMQCGWSAAGRGGFGGGRERRCARAQKVPPHQDACVCGCGARVRQAACPARQDAWDDACTRGWRLLRVRVDMQYRGACTRAVCRGVWGLPTNTRTPPSTLSRAVWRGRSIVIITIVRKRAWRSSPSLSAIAVEKLKARLPSPHLRMRAHAPQ